jgi:hypothetical protein
MCTALAALTLAGCAGGGPAPDRPITPDPSTSFAFAAVGRTMPVYYVAGAGDGFRLYRELRAATTDDPGSEAVRQMLTSPAADPDYRSYWPAGTRLRSPVRQAAGVVTVDLTRDTTDGPPVRAELAGLIVQQLVFTVQDALRTTDPVRLLVDGKPVDELWRSVARAAPVERADPYAVRSLVQIESPADGAVVGPEVTVSGEAAVFEATVPWEVLRDGAVVRSGVTSSAEGQRFSPFRFTVRLEPGAYEIRVVEDDPSGGEGRPPLADGKRVTVTG